jgi:hypothetical protein
MNNYALFTSKLRDRVELRIVTCKWEGSVTGFAKVIEVPSLATVSPRYIHIYFLPLQVSPLVGHLHAIIQLIVGSFRTYNGSVVLCALCIIRLQFITFGKFCRCQSNVRVCCLNVDKNISLNVKNIKTPLKKYVV